ncbi:acireductone synthase [Catenovulum sediminis]|uniref:Enolase-phosphatase E1 n=1 Tax=Catenovulum sediminis TaxID=1740262 RepID=A0ABV1RMI8_9ALTE|nr:acireductone synthase [Catenovulum sediminis]
MITHIITDIEGTTSSIAFVHTVLFPYARKRITHFLKAYREDVLVAEQINAVKLSCRNNEMTLDDVIAQLIEWIDNDVKEPSLKKLQGLIWQYGYEQGDFKGHLYRDAYQKLTEWNAQGQHLFVYSSGSVQAQKLLFKYSEFGDLTALFNGYFDTSVGHKREAGSYQNIHQSLACPAENVLFLSDIKEELDAAKMAGFNVLQLVRDDSVTVGAHPCVEDFSQIDISRICE